MRWLVVIALGLAAWATAVRFDALMASPFPYGVDGYFYPVQLRAFLASGELYYPSSPLTSWLMAPLAAIIDREPPEPPAPGLISSESY